MNYLRPDEKASQADIEKSRKSDDLLKKGAKTAANLGLAVSGAGIASKIAPFLSKYITPDLALKGISKLSPKVGDFLKRGMEAGLNVQDGLDFVKEQISNSAVDQRNIIEQYDPELNTYLKNYVDKGMSPLEAGKKAIRHDRFAKAIKQMEKDHKAPWTSIIESIFGRGDKAQQVTQQPIQQQQEPQPQQQQPGQGQQALMAILQKIQQTRGANP